MELVLKDGTKRHVELKFFPALEGWNIQRDYVKFIHTDDNVFRKEYTIRVLSYCTVTFNGQEFQMITDAIIDNHIGDWQNIKTVFNAVLTLNGIDPETHADQPMYWDKVGSQMAVAFLAQCEALIGPALKISAKTI